MRKVTREKTTRILIHILVWAVILALPVYSAGRFRIGSYFLITYYTFVAVNAIIFYSNYLFLVPLLFFQKKRHSYYIAALALVFFLYFISDFASDQISGFISANNNSVQLNNPPGERGSVPLQSQIRRFRFILGAPDAHLVGYTSSSILMVILSLGLRLLERQSKIEKMQEEMVKEKLNAELVHLKNQISPHFFFNTLNNIYSLIGRNNEDSKNAVIKLSKLMRYLLNESGVDNRLLSEEIEFMNNYIDLMKLRIGAKTRLNVNFPEEYSDIMIPHLLFISLIENAFKYGISVQEESFINISLGCSENEITFKCENGVQENSKGPDFESSGTGLKNLKKRLGLLYPGRHELRIYRTGNKFEANLIIRL